MLVSYETTREMCPRTKGYDGKRMIAKRGTLCHRNEESRYGHQMYYLSRREVGHDCEIAKCVMLPKFMQRNDSNIDDVSSVADN